MRPRQIDPQEIQVGDRVRLTSEFTVTRNGSGWIASNRFGVWAAAGVTWTLLDQPELPLTLASLPRELAALQERWEREGNHDFGEFSGYLQGKLDAAEDLAKILERLEPLP